MSEQLPEAIPVVNAVEFAAEMSKAWTRETDRIIKAIGLATVMAVGLISSINWGVQYKISRSRQILDSTRETVAQNRSLIDSLREDRITSETRFRALMGAVRNVELAIDRQQKGKGK